MILIKLKNLFLENGWTWLTALNTMLFSLLHFPCGTTLVNIYKETKKCKMDILIVCNPYRYRHCCYIPLYTIGTLVGACIKQSIHRRHPPSHMLCPKRNLKIIQVSFFCTSVFHGCAPYVVSFL